MAWMLRRQTEQTTGPDVIAEQRMLRLGGVDQWIRLSGTDVHNPALILLHGGPGLSETAMFEYFNGALAERFTVVYWDQRGAGRSASPDIDPASMTVEQFLRDLDELVEFVRERLGKDKVTIFGHSWGTALGVLYAARFPQKVAAYVGSGQIGDWPLGERLSYAYTLEAAERRNHQRALKALKAIGPPPHDAAGLFATRTWLQRLDGAFTPRAMWKLVRMMVGAPDATVLEVPATFRKFRACIDRMWPEVSKLNLLELAPRLEVPVYLFLGRHDHWVPPQASQAWFDVLTAPHKEIVWFEGSGHEPFMDEPQRFNEAMSTLVHPIAAAEDSCPPRPSPATSSTSRPDAAHG